VTGIAARAPEKAHILAQAINTSSATDAFTTQLLLCKKDGQPLPRIGPGPGHEPLQFLDRTGSSRDHLDLCLEPLEVQLTHRRVVALLDQELS
jgi:hypothetical protein